VAALTRPAGTVHLPGSSGSWTASDRRLALFVALSLLLHLMLGLDWGVDSGRQSAQALPALTARLAPAADPLVEGVLALAEANDAPPVVPAEGASGDAAAPAPQPVAEPVPVQPARERTEPAAETPVAAPRPGTERDGGPELNWYAGRDLDVLPMPLGPIEPLFPLNAQLRGVSGKVTLSVSIDPAGRVVDVSVVRAEPPGFFEDAARAAFRAATYSPGIKGGRAVHSRIQTVVVFEVASLLPR
jgi:protein TonB